MGWAKAFTLLGITWLAFAPGHTAGKSNTGEESSELAVKIFDRYLIVVEGSVAELHGLSFLLDTGASYSAIDRSVAERLGLPRGRANLINFDKTVTLEWCEVPEVAYGPEHASNVRVMIEDLRYLRPSGVWLDGVIGLDLLRRKNLLVDYSRKRAVFGTRENAGMHAVPMRVDAISLRVGVELAGRPVWMIVDTGSGGTVLYADRLEAMLADYRVEGRTIGQSLGGAVESQLAFVPRLRLGGQDLEREVVLVRAPGGGMLPDVVGYLGPASLEARQIAFDFVASQLLWTK
jgi:Aspartyl protease